jgi:hypothetical protein
MMAAKSFHRCNPISASAVSTDCKLGRGLFRHSLSFACGSWPSVGLPVAYYRVLEEKPDVVP